jgi:seryl-tRNA synthetase
MLDIKFIRENKELIALGAQKKHISFNPDELIALDDKRLSLLKEVEEFRAKQNEASTRMVGGAADRTLLIEEMKVVKESLKLKEDELEEVMKEWRLLMLRVPNIPDMSVPEGAGDAENQEVKRVGEPTIFSFSPRDHVTIMEAQDMADFERGTKVAGFRGYFLKGDGALLEYAVWQLALKHFMSKGFTLLHVPSLVRKDTLVGTGYLPGGEEDLYRTQDDEYLAGTGEVATMGYYMNEVIDLSKGPVKFLAFSPCFRREAGAHGKDVKGLIRVHEFFKWEQVVLCEASHEESVKFHEEIQRNTEELMEALKLPYHVVANCGGDLGLGQVKKYDIEAWLPSENTYRETGSASYFHDFQTRRLNIRYRDEEGKMRFVHSLNNTALSGRPLIMIIENYQQEDGSIKIPDVLQKYMGGQTVISKKS